jgi:hypothetical protein
LAEIGRDDLDSDTDSITHFDGKKFSPGVSRWTIGSFARLKIEAICDEVSIGTRDDWTAVRILHILYWHLFHVFLLAFAQLYSTLFSD